MGVAMAGRMTPRRRPIRRRALAMVAPVLPALTIALAWPSRTCSAALTRDESFFRRTPWAGSSCISITSDAATMSSPPVANWSRTSGRPTSDTGTPRSRAAWTAPAMISAGALSPPMASTATGSIGRRVVTPTRNGAGGAHRCWPHAGRRPASREGAAGEGGAGARGGGGGGGVLAPPPDQLLNLDGLAAAVPPAVGAHDVGQLGVPALRAHAAGRSGQCPVRRPAAAALRLRCLLLGDG